MLKVSTKDVLNSISALTTLSSKDVKIKAAYQLAVVIKAINAISTQYNETRVALVTKFATKDESGELKFLDEAKNVEIVDIESFNKEHNELLDVENEIGVSKINLSTFGDVSIPTHVLMPLDWLINGDA